MSCLLSVASGCGSDKAREPGIEVAPQEIKRAAKATRETPGARFTSRTVATIARPEQEKLGGPVVSTSIDAFRYACAGTIDSRRSTEIECREIPRSRGTRYRIIEVADISYYGGPAARQRFQTRKWIKAPVLGGTRVSLVRSWATDPVALARALAAAGPRRVGTETVYGVPARHYAATVDRHEFAKLVRRRDPPRLGYDVITGLHVEAWVDDRNVIRRTRERMDVESFTDVAHTPPNKESYTQTSDLRFGPQPRIAVPPHETERAAVARRKRGG